MVTVVAPRAPAPGVGRGRHRLLLALPIALGALVGLVLVAAQTDSVSGLLDLRIYLGAARTLADGGSPYDYLDPTFRLGSTYPPLWSLLVRPFTDLDVHLLEYLWTAVTLALWGRTLWVLARRGARPVPVAWLWLATLVTAPVWNTLNQGQINVLLWCLVVTDLDRVVRTGRAGWRIGVAAALKLTPAVFGVLLLPARRVRPAVVTAVTALGLTVLVWLIDPTDSSRYWFGVLGDTDRVGLVEDPQNASLAGALARMGVMQHGLGRVLVVALGVFVAVLAVRSFRMALDTGALVVAATVGGCAMALLAPISWTHHLVFLCFPLVLLLGRRTWAARTVLVTSLVLLVDPVGWGRAGVTSTLRTIGLLAVLAAAPRLIRAEVAWRRPAREAVDVCDAVPRGR